MDAIEKIRKEIDKWTEAMADAVGEYSDGVRFALNHFAFVLDTIEEEHFRDSTKMIKELEMPYQSVDSGLVLDIPELVEKINEIIRYLNEKEEE